MPTSPIWPKTAGPRILTLVGNDLSIDVRARKTASGLARAGFAVVALGIDNVGAIPQSEWLDGALLWRTRPSADPAVSPRPVRLSRNELRDFFRFRSDRARAELQLVRRQPSHPDADSGSVNPDPQTQGDLRGRPGILQRAHLLWLRIRFKASFSAYKSLARPGKRAPRTAKWERDLPELHRYEQSLGPLIDELQPDLIHVHDVFHIGVASRAKERARRLGHQIKIVYDAHEYVPGLPIDDRRRNAYATLESQYISDADAVVTVSPGLARLIERDHGRAAEVILNAPDLDTAVTVESARLATGIPNAARMLIYVGGIAPHRGAEGLVDVVARLPSDIHLVFVSATTTGYIEELVKRSKRLGVGHRVHLAPYVAPEAVVSYMETADVSLIPLSRAVPNYEVALPNKLFQSIHAGVPVVVSDNPDMKRFVESTGIGEVFDAAAEGGMERAIEKVLDYGVPYITALREPGLVASTTWRAQSEKLFGVYRQLGIEAELS
jgi:glycosyltransferase involved in cell wall biosynthesis